MYEVRLPTQRWHEDDLHDALQDLENNPEEYAMDDEEHPDMIELAEAFLWHYARKVPLCVSWDYSWKYVEELIFEFEDQKTAQAFADWINSRSDYDEAEMDS